MRLPETDQKEKEHQGGDDGSHGKCGRKPTVRPFTQPADHQVAEDASQTVDAAQQALHAGPKVALRQLIDIDLAGDEKPRHEHAVEELSLIHI